MRTILLVEDDPTTSARVACELEEEGFRVCGAAGDREAFALMERESISLVVVDPAVGGMSGLDLMRRIIERSPRIPIVIYSSDPELRENFGCWAADHFVLKWGDPEGLRGAIREALLSRAA